MEGQIGFKTDYSLLKSMLKVKTIIEYAKSNNYKYLGILDDEAYGIAEFYYGCKESKIKPIIGIIVKLKNYKVYFYIQNFVGYQNIIKIKYLENKNKLNLTYLKKYSEGLICVLPYESTSLKEKLSSIYKVYLSYKTKEEKFIIEKITSDIVFLNEIACLTKDDTKYLEFLYKIGEEELNSDLNYVLEIDDDDKKHLNEFQKNIDFEIVLSKNYIPSFTKDKVTSIKLLNSLSINGLKKRLNGNVSKEYVDRLKYELNVINELNFTDYFLIVYDYVKFAKKNNIYVGPGRGSAAGSLVSYTLGITEIDPLKYDLLFERFLNKERITMPDIDMDFEDIKRGEVINYVKEKYGKNNVSLIVTYSRLASRQVIRDVAKVLDIDKSLIDNLTKLIDPKRSLKENIDEKIKTFLNANNLNELYDISMKLEGIKKNTSIHAAGVIISSEPLASIVPILESGNELLAGFTMEYLERFGLLKMDFLALKNLTELHKMVDIIKKENKNFNLKNIPLNDNKTLELFRRADTDNIFQFESSGMKNFLRKLKPNSFNDLVSANALFRPGPMDNIDTFIERKEGKVKIDYIHPSLEKILKPTFGVIVYQEQIMQILSVMAGYSFAEADLVRRAMSKKKLEDLEKEKSKFLINSKKRGYTDEVSNKVYNMILKFANYGFNKSHSVSYALLGYQMAFIKANYSKYFQVNSLNSLTTSKTKIKDVIEDAKKKGMKIIPPNINLSSNNYILDDKNIILPLYSIKNITSAISDKIISHAPYTDFFYLTNR